MATGTTVEITMPEMGESVTEGTILEWLKRVGDTVEADEGVVEVSTDKVDAEVPAPASGVLTKILVQPDETVPTGTVLGEIEVNGASPTAGDGGSPEAAATRAPDFAADESAVEEAAHGASADVEHAQSASAAEPPSEPQPAQETAELIDVVIPEMGESVSEGTVLEWLKQVGDHVELNDGLVEISTDKVDAELPSPVAGTLAEILVQPDETVSTGTVVARIAPGASVAPGRGPAATLVRFMEESRGIPTATSFRALEVDTLDARRRALKEAGRKLSFTHLVAWAIVQAARDMPVMTNSFEERDGKPHRVIPAVVCLVLAWTGRRQGGYGDLWL